tara:strand:+ start:248 stop:490 length:243 start_codon:yes stop_codon:yes gene_type:complete
MKQWQRRILKVDWEGKDLTALQIREKIVGEGSTNFVPNTRQIGYFLKRHNAFRIIGEHNGVRLYRRINNEVSENSMGGWL